MRVQSVLGLSIPPPDNYASIVRIILGVIGGEALAGSRPTRMYTRIEVVDLIHIQGIVILIQCGVVKLYDGRGYRKRAL